MIAFHSSISDNDNEKDEVKISSVSLEKLCDKRSNRSSQILFAMAASHFKPSGVYFRTSFHPDRVVGQRSRVAEVKLSTNDRDDSKVTQQKQ